MRRSTRQYTDRAKLLKAASAFSDASALDGRASESYHPAMDPSTPFPGCQWTGAQITCRTRSPRGRLVPPHPGPLPQGEGERWGHLERGGAGPYDGRQRTKPKAEPGITFYVLRFTSYHSDLKNSSTPPRASSTPPPIPLP